VYSLQVAKRVTKEIQPYPPKIFKQVASKIFALSINPRPHDSKKVGEGRRVDIGEYRIFYVVGRSGANSKRAARRQTQRRGNLQASQAIRADVIQLVSVPL